MDELKSVEDLYKKLLPALKAKVGDLKRRDINYIKEEDIWNYLKDHYWIKAEKLTLGEVVNDVLSTPNGELEKYVNKQKKTNKKNTENLL